MKERQILFSAPMVRAILDGSKTQTRRIVKTGKWEHENSEYGVSFGNCPYGEPGDRLWVRETWNKFDAWEGYFYAADDHPFGIGEADDPDHIEQHDIRWKPSIHMPRAASRITLEVTGVRVERLQDISEADARAEGVEPVVVGEGWRRYCDSGSEEVGVPPCADARHSFQSLWEQINGAGSWAANPWVWVVEFQRATAQAGKE